MVDKEKCDQRELFFFHLFPYTYNKIATSTALQTQEKKYSIFTGGNGV
jgi:alpha-glucuronidase